MIAIRSTWNIEHHELASGRLSFGRVTRVADLAAVPGARPARVPRARTLAALSARRIAVLQLVRQHSATGGRARGMVTRTAIALGLTCGAVGWHLAALAKRGLVRNAGYGDWRAEVSDSVSETRTD